MPTLTCALCSSPSSQPEPPSSNPLGPPDFDTRPAEPLRSTLPLWLQNCPHCLYSAPSIDQAPPGVAEAVRNPLYLEQPNPFFRHACLLEILGHLPQAGWTALHAAWAADDASDPTLARRARLLALALFKKGKSAGLSFMDSTAEEFALATDLYRRLGEFDDARATVLAALDEPSLPPLLEDLLRAQLAFIDRADSAPHSLSELPARPPGARRVTLD